MYTVHIKDIRGVAVVYDNRVVSEAVFCIDVQITSCPFG